MKMVQFMAGLHQFSSFILYSISSTSKDGSTNPIIIQFLVNSVGFSQEEYLSISSNFEVCRRFKCTKKSVLVIDFLKSIDFGDTYIRKLIASIPEVPRNDVEQTLKPKTGSFRSYSFVAQIWS